jgi:regulator of PEP synthase PpsR (kinase-PPPase family)
MSDGTGETATSLVRAAMAQFHDKDIYFTRYKNIRSKEQISSIFEENSKHYHLIAHTIVSSDLRVYIQELAKTHHVRTIDLIGPMLNALSNAYEIEPDNIPGKLHEVNDSYFKRVAAIEFTMNHDDGRNLQNLKEADIVLLGVSRTSKTPLSMYLSLQGYKTINIPLIHGMKIPQELFEIDQRKIFCLTIDAESLFQIRSNRLTRLGIKHKDDEYADMNKILQETTWAQELFHSNRKWPIFNVTNKAVEETATEIIKFINQRKRNRFLED